MLTSSTTFSITSSTTSATTEIGVNLKTVFAVMHAIFADLIAIFLLLMPSGSSTSPVGSVIGTPCYTNKY